MGLISRSKKGAHTSAAALPSPISDQEKQLHDNSHANGDGVRLHHPDDMSDPNTRLHRDLKARQVTMIAIGGAM